jgi:pteridine reductase
MRLRSSPRRWARRRPTSGTRCSTRTRGAPFFLSQAAAPHLRATHGAIVNMADIYAERPLRAHALYGMSKAALVHMTRALALELGPDVRVNAIAPGAILWPDGGKDDAAKQAMLDRTPLHRTGTPEKSRTPCAGCCAKRRT